MKHTKVNFRKFKDGDIIALFPEIQETNKYVDSYMHIGQHGNADYNGVIKNTTPATKEEYKPLLEELLYIGYKNLKVIKRFKRLIK